MTRYDYFNKVHFPKLDDTPARDRRGKFAIFSFQNDKRWKNWSHIHRTGIETVQSLIILLSSQYDHLSRPDYAGREGEQAECWVHVRTPEDTETDERQIVIVHKYWNEAQIEAFKKIVAAIAPLYQWTVTTDPEEKADQAKEESPATLPAGQ